MHSNRPAKPATELEISGPMPLFDHWAEVAARLRAAPRLWVGSDFDCTLAPFTDDPDEVVRLMRAT